ncbi:MAG: hypothetical protein ACOZD0_04595 [Pseudomonadota bacterium]
MRVAALRSHLRRHPPLQAMVQAYLGIEPAGDIPREQTDEEIEAELQQLGAMGLL